MANNTTPPTTTPSSEVVDPYRLVVVGLRSIETGEMGFFLGEPMLIMAEDAQHDTTVAISVSGLTATVSGEMPVGTLLKNLRERLGST